MYKRMYLAVEDWFPGQDLSDLTAKYIVKRTPKSHPLPNFGPIFWEIQFWVKANVDSVERGAFAARNCIGHVVSSNVNLPNKKSPYIFIMVLNVWKYVKLSNLLQSVSTI